MALHRGDPSAIRPVYFPLDGAPQKREVFDDVAERPGKREGHTGKRGAVAHPGARGAGKVNRLANATVGLAARISECPLR